MLNFYPGPSRIYPQVAQFAQDAFSSGILERNHRSTPVKNLVADCIRSLKSYLDLPESYAVYFVSSATEAWEICAQSLLEAPAFAYNGAFGEKWYHYTSRLMVDVKQRPYGVEEAPDFSGEEDICFVGNETSNGTWVPRFPDPRQGLICVDAVSSLGGIQYDMRSADVWISSVQKCFGLPSGLGLLLLSPKALERAEARGDRAFYNSVLFLEDNFSKNETPYTPSIISIYLLKRLLEVLPPLSTIDASLKQRAMELYAHFDAFSPLVQSTEFRSPTIVALATERPNELLRFLEERGAIVGKGYGPWKENSFRIANFPAIPDEDYVKLSRILATFAGDSPKNDGLHF